jgi:hypothetical protein
VRKRGSRIRILKRTGVVMAGASHSRRNLREQQRRDDDRVASLLNRREDGQALGVALFVWIERVDEDARVNRVPEVRGTSRPNGPARRRSRGGHLSTHLREETYAADARAESPFETPAGAKESLPGVSGVSGPHRRVLSGLEGKNHAHGPAAMRQDVGRARLSHVTQDAGGMSLQFPDADDLPCRCPPSGVVVPHVTTLGPGRGAVKAIRSCSRLICILPSTL